MSKHHANKMQYAFPETNGIYVPIKKIKKNTQITTKDTGWSAKEKERMRKLGYDSLDIVKEWYS